MNEAEKVRNDVIKMQQWAAKLAPKDHPDVKQLVQALFQARNAIEKIAFNKK